MLTLKDPIRNILVSTVHSLWNKIVYHFCQADVEKQTKNDSLNNSKIHLKTNLVAVERRHKNNEHLFTIFVLIHTLKLFFNCFLNKLVAKELNFNIVYRQGRRSGWHIHQFQYLKNFTMCVLAMVAFMGAF